MAEMNMSDVANLANTLKGNDGLMGGNGSTWLFWILILFFLFSGGGWGNNAAQNALTRAEMQDGFNNQNMINTLSGMSNQINTGFDNVALGFANQNQVLNSGFNSVNQSICNLGYQMSQNCCDLKSVIHAEGEATRALITQNTIDTLNAKLADKDRELQSAIFAASQLTQTNNLEAYMRQLNSGCGCCGC